MTSWFPRRVGIRIESTMLPSCMSTAAILVPPTSTPTNAPVPMAVRSIRSDVIIVFRT